MFYFYVIYSKKLDRFYTGHTADLQKRINEHNNGISKFTAKATDWKILYYEEFASREFARKRELEVKKKKSRKYVEWLIANKN